jgi:hypothetical protein
MIPRRLHVIHYLKKNSFAMFGPVLLVGMCTNLADLHADASKAKFGVSVSVPVSSAPVVSAFQPVTGVAGTTVTMTGLNLRNVTHVSINNVACSSFTVLGDDRIIAEVPTGATTGNITVQADLVTGTSAQPFLVISQPEISAVVPDSSAPGHSVSIRGSGFWGVQEVRFESVGANRFWVHSDTEIEVFVPFGAVSGRIEVSSAAGQGASSDSFAVLPPPNALVFVPKEDTYVASNSATATHGAGAILQIKKTSSQDHRALLKFRVIGLWTRPDTVKLRLHVVNSGGHSGALYHVSNDYSISATGWIENALNWNNAPALAGTVIDSVGESMDNEIIEFDVTDIVTEDGYYSFAVAGRSSDVVRFSSREGEVIPELVAKFASTKTGQATLGGQTDDLSYARATLPAGSPDLAMHPNYPNPFNAETTIQYALPKASTVKLTVYNVLGQEVKVLVDEHQDAGLKKVVWDGRSETHRPVGSGIFFVQLIADDQTAVQQILLQK